MTMKTTKITLGTLRAMVRRALNESLPPGRWDGNPGEPQDPKDTDRLNQPLGEVDTDPSNNPGRPADAGEYIGMKPKGSSAMARPDDAKAYIGMTGTGAGDAGSDETGDEGGEGAEETPEEE